MSIHSDVADTINFLGILLLLVILFTSALSTSLSAEFIREGGQKTQRCKNIMQLSSMLAFVTTATLISISPTLYKVVISYTSNDWQHSYFLFVIVYLLLIPLWIWQVRIANMAKELSH